MARQITVYEPGDLLTVDQAADHFGYTRDYFRAMIRIDDKAADLKLIRLKIETDPDWRAAGPGSSSSTKRSRRGTPRATGARK